MDEYTTIKAKLGFDLLKGNSPCLRKVKEKILRIAPYDVTVLISGQSGTGKELSAKLVHFLSPRSKHPFVAINCGAIPKDLFENELFGHKKGAYTHADTSESGLIAAANNGTLFMDEVESLPPASQIKILRFIEEKRYKPLGQTKYLSSNVRIIAAAKDDLWDMVEKKQFREDLFYRLNVVQIHLPPLRNRREDIPILANHFINEFSILYNKPIKGIHSAALLKLMQNEWHGNVRELQNVLQEAVVISETEWINATDIDLTKLNTKNIPEDQVSFKSAKKRAIEKFEKDYLKKVISLSNGNITSAAKLAQKDRRAFCRLLKKYDIKPADFRISQHSS